MKYILFLLLANIHIANAQNFAFDYPTIYVQGGCFMMGCDPERDGDCNANEPLHEVCLKDYKIGAYEVSQAQWTAIMGYNPSFFQGCPDSPVERVSWEEVQIFIEKLNQKTGKKYRLPTESEWEYAARGGIQKDDCRYIGRHLSNPVLDLQRTRFGDCIQFRSAEEHKKQALAASTTQADTTPRIRDDIYARFVYSRNADTTLENNGASAESLLHVQYRYVREWCADTAPSQPNNPPKKYDFVVVRGASWLDRAPHLHRIATRRFMRPNDKDTDGTIGFRLVLD